MTAKKSTSQMTLLSQDDKMRKVANLYALRFIDWQLHAKFDQLRQHGQLLNQPHCLWLTGNSGAGKTELLQKYAELFPPTLTIDRIERPVVYVKVPFEKSSSSALVGALLNALEISMPSNRTISERIALLQNQFEQQSVIIVFLDEVEHLLTGTQSQITQKANILKQLVSGTGIPFVFSGLPSSMRLDNFDGGQLTRMCQQAVLGDFSASDSESRRAFRRWLHDIDLQLPFDALLQISSPNFAEQVHTATKGNTALVMRLVRTICFSAIEAGRDIPDDEDIEAGFRAVNFSRGESIHASMEACNLHQFQPRIIRHPPIPPVTGGGRQGMIHKLLRWFKKSVLKSA